MGTGILFHFRTNANSCYATLFILGYLVFTAGNVLAQTHINGKIVCRYKCDNITTFYTIELLQGDKPILATDVGSGFTFNFMDIAPEDNMRIGWVKNQPSQDGMRPLELVVKQGRVSGCFLFSKSEDIYYLQKIQTLDKIKRKKQSETEHCFTAFIEYKDKNVLIDQNLYYSMLKELDYQMVETIKNTYKSKIKSITIENSREIKRSIFHLLRTEGQISHKTPKIIAQIKSWIEFSRIVYRYSQRNFAKEPVSISSVNSIYDFFDTDEHKNMFIDDVQYIMEILKDDDIKIEVLALVGNLTNQKQIDTENYPVDHFLAIINGDVVPEEVDMRILSYYINALYDPISAS